MGKLNVEQIDKHFDNFLDFCVTYADYLCKFSLERIGLMYYEALGLGMTEDDLIAQIMYATGVSKELGVDLWSAKYDLMHSAVDLDSINILDIGGGVIPVIGSQISEMHPSSHVAILDPNTISEWYQGDNFAVVNKKCIFDKKRGVYTDMSGFDFVYGVHPCEGTVPMIRCASFYQKEYMVWLCDCIHDGFGKAKTHDGCYKYIINLAKGLAPKDFCVEVSTHRIGDIDAPVIKCLKRSRGTLRRY